MNALTSFDEVLATTRSVRRQLDFERPVATQLILDCIDLAVQAPTGLPAENWRFVVVRDPTRKAALAELYAATLERLASDRGIAIKPTQRALVARLHEMPALIFVCAQATPPLEEVGSQIAFYGSILPAAWSLMLALRARGIGTTWTSLLAARQEEVGQLLKLPAGAIHTVMLPVAYMKDARLRPAERMRADEVAFADVWGVPFTAPD